MIDNKWFGDEENSPDEESILPDEDFMPKLTEEYRIQLEREWTQWSKDHASDILDVTDDQLRDKLMKDLTHLCTMTSEEYTLHRKFVEIQRDYPYDFNQAKKINTFWSTDTSPAYPILEKYKEDIWIPNDLQDYKKLKPRIVWTNDDPSLIKKWNTLRTFLSTMINNSNIGRNLYFIVEDEITGKYLGVMALSSDFLDLTPRDTYIGWSREVKTHGRKINHTAIGSTIVPTQPLGYTYVGGKLMALLVVSKVVENAWNEMYNNPSSKIYKAPSKLVGITTTSLYDTFSQYTGLKHWKKLGHSAGSIKFEPTKDAIDMVKKWAQKNYPRKYWEWWVATEPAGMPLKRDYKQRCLSFTYAKLGIEKKYFETNHSRGIFFCPLFNNTKEFLRNEVPEEQVNESNRLFDNSVESLTELWKEKYASKRISKLIEENRVDINDMETLFYDDIIKMEKWEQVRSKYLKDVGR